MKAKLRSQKLLERVQHDPLEKKRKDEQILKNILALPAFKKAETILFYMPIKGEVDLSALLEVTKNSLNKKFVLPRVTKGKTTLELYYIQNPHDLEKGSFNILEPKLHLKKAPLKNLDLALIPGVVFFDNGHRIGYGKGYYDRLLKKTSCLKIGVAYEFQIVKNIPGEKHDTPMDMIITEKKARTIQNRPQPKRIKPIL